MFGLKHCCWGHPLFALDRSENGGYQDNNANSQGQKRASTVSLTMQLEGNAYNLAFVAFTSGLFNAVSMAKPGPKPVSDLTLVEVGSGRLH